MTTRTDRDGLGLADGLSRAGSATLGESGGLVLSPSIRPAWPGARLVGLAYTVECPAGDNLALHAAVVRAPEGSVLVVSTGGSTQFGYWGEILAAAAVARGLCGLVIDGGVRDVEEMAALRFPIFAGATSLAGTSKSGGGGTGHPVRVGGVTVATGDWVVGNADGVAVIPAGRVEETLRAAEVRLAREAGYLDRLRQGATTIELLGLETQAASVRDAHPTDTDALEAQA